MIYIDKKQEKNTKEIVRDKYHSENKRWSPKLGWHEMSKNN